MNGCRGPFPGPCVSLAGVRHPPAPLRGAGQSTERPAGAMRGPVTPDAVCCPGTADGPPGSRPCAATRWSGLRAAKPAPQPASTPERTGPVHQAPFSRGRVQFGEVTGIDLRTVIPSPCPPPSRAGAATFRNRSGHARASGGFPGAADPSGFACGAGFTGDSPGNRGIPPRPPCEQPDSAVQRRRTAAFGGRTMLCRHICYRVQSMG